LEHSNTNYEKTYPFRARFRGLRIPRHFLFVANHDDHFHHNA